MKLYLDELLTDMDASQIPITDNSPLSLDRIIQKTVSNCNGLMQDPAHYKKRFYAFLIAAILVGLLITTALAATIAGYLKTVNIEYPVSDDGVILPPEAPDLGITLSASNVSPTGLQLNGSVEVREYVGTISAGSDYYLEVQTDRGWLAVPMLYEHRWQWDNQKLGGAQCTWLVDWTGIYGELAPGNYRVRKPFTVTSNDGAVKTCFLSAEFIVER